MEGAPRHFMVEFLLSFPIAWIFSWHHLISHMFPLTNTHTHTKKLLPSEIADDYLKWFWTIILLIHILPLQLILLIKSSCIPEQYLVCLENFSFGPPHHRLKSHMMFISMQHVLLSVGWEVDGVSLNAILVFTLANFQFLFATCKPHPPSNRMLISPFPGGNTRF